MSTDPFLHFTRIWLQYIMEHTAATPIPYLSSSLTHCHRKAHSDHALITTTHTHSLSHTYFHSFQEQKMNAFFSKITITKTPSNPVKHCSISYLYFKSLRKITVDVTPISKLYITSACIVTCAPACISACNLSFSCCNVSIFVLSCCWSACLSPCSCSVVRRRCVRSALSCCNDCMWLTRWRSSSLLEDTDAAAADSSGTSPVTDKGKDVWV